MSSIVSQPNNFIRVQVYDQRSPCLHDPFQSLSFAFFKNFQFYSLSVYQPQVKPKEERSFWLMPVWFIVTINLLPTRIIVQNYLDHKRIHFRNNHNLHVSIYAFNRLIPHIVCTDSSNELALFTKLMSMSSYSWQIDCCLLLIIRGWDSLATNVKYCINRNYIFI